MPRLWSRPRRAALADGADEKRRGGEDGQTDHRPRVHPGHVAQSHVMDGDHAAEAADDEQDGESMLVAAQAPSDGHGIHRREGPVSPGA